MQPSPIGVVGMLLLGVVLLWIVHRTAASILAPTGLFVILWCTSLAIYYSGAIIYYPIRIGTLAIFVGTLLFFVAGGAIAGFGVRNAETPATSTTEATEETRNGDDASALTTTAFMLFAFAVIGGVGYYVILHRLIGIQSLWRDPVAVRLAEIGPLQHLGWIGAARSLLVSAFILALLLLRDPQQSHRRALKVILAIAFCLAIPNGGRSILLMLGTWAVLAVLYSAEAAGERHVLRRYARFLLVLLAAGLVYFFAIGLVLNKSLGQSYAINNVTRLPHALNGIVDLLHYQVGSIPSFEQLLDNANEFRQHTSFTFGVVWRVLAGIDPTRFAAPDYVQPFVNVPLAGNLYTWLDAFYLDFGGAGLVFMPFLFGFATTWFYHRMRHAPSRMNIYMSSLIGVMIIQSTGTNRFGMLQSWIWLLSPWCVLQAVNVWRTAHRITTPSTVSGAVTATP